MTSVLAGVIGMIVGVAVGAACAPFAKRLRWNRRPRRMAVCPKCTGPAAGCEPVAALGVPRLRVHGLGGACRSGRVQRFLQQIRDAGPGDERSTLSAIGGRHGLVVKHADILRCEGSLQHRLNAECGPRGFMFFPMAAVGWPEAGEDAWQLKNRTIKPWGVTDPFLRLIHASRFEALPS